MSGVRRVLTNSLQYLRQTRQTVGKYFIQPKVQMEQNEYNVVPEGKAEVLLPKNVFYNPVQEFNRDLTVAVISEFSRQKFIKDNTKSIEQSENPNSELSEQWKNVKAGKRYENGIKIFEGLAASGLRSVRFGLEIPGVSSVLANDFDQNAVAFINKNIEKNNLTELMTSNCDDAAMVMYKHKNIKDRFDVIDLDPYGSPSPFLDATVQAVADGGLLCVTCTDAAVLCGNSGETCYSKYGAMSVRHKASHEAAVRIILQCIESHANRYSRYIEPLISLSIDFYFRVFVRVNSGQAKVKRSASKMAMTYYCRGCGSYALQRLGELIPTKNDNIKYAPGTGPPVTDKCEHCGSGFYVGGPMWADPICDINFIEQVIEGINNREDKLATSDRIIGMLTVQKEELHDVPLFFHADSMFAFAKTNPMSLIQMRSAVLNAGFRVSLSHAMKNSMKTDAPHSVLWDIIRTWVKVHPVSEKRLQENNAVKTMLEKECKTKISFEEHPDANPKSRQDKLVRYQINPPNWGPKARATRKVGQETQEERSKTNQGKKNNKKRPGDSNDSNSDNSDNSDNDSEALKKRKLSKQEVVEKEEEKPTTLEKEAQVQAPPKSKKQPSWATAEVPPERVSQQCRHYMKKGQCRYGSLCKFSHTNPF